jgi:hypothetical protein
MRELTFIIVASCAAALSCGVPDVTFVPGDPQSDAATDAARDAPHPGDAGTDVPYPTRDE